MTTQATTRLSIDEAARVLGVSRPTIRRRLRSGGLKGSQVTTPHGRKWLVDVPTPLAAAAEEPVTPQGGSAGPPPPPAREVELLQAHVDDLRRQLEDRTREVGQLHTLLAQAHQRLLTVDQVTTHGESAGGQTDPQTPTGAAHGQLWPERRSWWQRLLWG
jgi:excisionase family DNA binding protein